MFDGIAAISEESRDSLLGYWRWLGVTRHPPVVALPLGVDPMSTVLAGNGKASPLRTPDGSSHDVALDQSARRSAPTLQAETPIVLCVGTMEGRKNHLQLFDACEQLWSGNASFQLHVIGHVNAESGGAALARLRKLQASGRPIRYDGPGTDEEIARAYDEAAFTVYPSIAEGFGLPVIESLARGKPCICSARGALGEISRGGGCVALDVLDAAHLSEAILSLLNFPANLSTLASVARGRSFKSWADYGRELIAWMQSLPRL
jgi:glycosyltransferase involved in cell wall biosynthesis